MPFTSALIRHLQRESGVDGSVGLIKSNAMRERGAHCPWVRAGRGKAAASPQAGPGCSGWARQGGDPTPISAASPQETQGHEAGMEGTAGVGDLSIPDPAAVLGRGDAASCCTLPLQTHSGERGQTHSLTQGMLHCQQQPREDPTRPRTFSSLPHHTWPDPPGAQPPCRIFMRLFKYKAKTPGNSFCSPGFQSSPHRTGHAREGCAQRPRHRDGWR